ncbi:MAG: TetR/AcrR family transcriptional regulator [Candidatus Dormibacteraeota bacterium]|nr:TetR/AcrR family transcriptional regulator [Candidatus Dormibacteraeota bacterium]
MLSTDLRRRLPRAEREEQLLNVAQALFAERGFREPSMDEIALRAGVTKPLLYDHFGSKDGLIAACIRHAGGQLLSDVEAAVGAATGAEQVLAAGFGAFFGFVEAFGQGWFMLIGENSVVGPAAEALESIRRQQAAYVAQKLVGEFPHAEPDDVRAFAEAIIGACERVALWRRDRPDVSAAKATAALMALVWGGLASLSGRA